MATAGLAIVGLAWFVGLGSTLTLPHLEVIREAVTSTAALFLAFGGASRKRRKLVWMAYAMTVPGSLKTGHRGPARLQYALSYDLAPHLRSSLDSDSSSSPGGNAKRLTSCSVSPRRKRA